MTATNQSTGVSADVDRPQHGRTLTGSLGVTAIVFMVVAAASPLTVVGGAAPLGILLGNGVGFPAMYAISAVVLLLFSVGLATMAKHVPKPGAFFTFVGYGLGRPMGLATAYLALLTYTTIQVSVYGYMGYILQVTVAGLGGPDLPWYLYALAVDRPRRHPRLPAHRAELEGARRAARRRDPHRARARRRGRGRRRTRGPVARAVRAREHRVGRTRASGLMFAIAAFIGFEATAIFRDEAKNPSRTIPIATYVAVIGIGVFYTLASWGLVMAWGPSGVVDAAAADPGAMVIITTLNYLGPIGEVIINVLLITSMFACVLSFHNVITRYQHSMSTAGVLPRRLGDVHHQAPLAAHLVARADGHRRRAHRRLRGARPRPGAAGLHLVRGRRDPRDRDPHGDHERRRHRVLHAQEARRRELWHTVIAPVLGLVGLIGSAVIITAYFPMLVGDVDAEGAPVFGALSIALIAVILLTPVFGLRAGARAARSATRRRTSASPRRSADDARSAASARLADPTTLAAHAANRTRRNRRP